jgi:hypothetical protein
MRQYESREGVDNPLTIGVDMNKQDQQSYIVHQMHLSPEGSRDLEVEGWDSKNPEVRAYAAKSSGSKKWKPMDWRFYRPVMRIKANGLEGVFHVGNGYPQSDKDSRVDMGRAYSCSVGDIVQCGGLYWMVEPYGFKDISSKMRIVKQAVARFHPELAARQAI